MTEIILTPSLDRLPQVAADLAEKALGYAEEAQAESTRKNYRHNWETWVEWCELFGQPPLPASDNTVALHITAMGEVGYKPASISLRLTSIRQAHRLAEEDDPTSSEKVRQVFQGIKRSQGTAQDQKAPITPDHLRRIVKHLLLDQPIDLRDRALLLLGFAGAFRRSELVGIHLEHMDWREEGLVVTLPRSKTDQEGQGRQVAVLAAADPILCPLSATKAWMKGMEITEGPLFRGFYPRGGIRDDALTTRSVANIVKRRLEEIGLDPKLYSGHSLRAGFATAAAMQGATEIAIMRQTGHRSLEMVRRYVREGNLFRKHAGEGLL